MRLPNRSIATLALLPVVAAAAYSAQLTWLPPLPGESGSDGAIDISADGRTVLGASGGKPTVWRDGEPIQLIAPDPYTRINAYGLSPEGDRAVGQVNQPFNIGGTTQPDPRGLTIPIGIDGSGPIDINTPINTQSFGTERAVIWDSLSEPATVLELPSQAPTSPSIIPDAFELSSDGALIIGSYPVDGQGAFWTGDGSGWNAMIPGTPNFAYDVSADGVVGGTAGDQAFRWTPADGVEYLGELPGGDTFSTVWGVSNNGRYLVGSSATEFGFETFLWEESTGMRSLNSILPGSDNGSLTPNAVSDDGIIVGMDRFRAFLWSPNRGLGYLDELVELEEGEQLIAATAISADGRTIAGSGSRGAFTIAVAIPEPGAALLFVAGASLVARPARRSALPR